MIEIPRSSRRLSDFRVRREADAFVVDGEGLKLLMERHDLENPDTLRWWLMLLEDIGVIEALRQAGIKDGDTVRIDEWEFEYLS